MAERSFVEEVKKLRLGAGEVFRGEGILAVTKALLESGVAYVAGYQGAPISHLMDVLADAQDILAEHGIRFENSASEATAAATLAASVNYPLRGAVTFKATGRHQRRVRCAGQPGLGRRDRRRAGHRRRGLRRRLVDHAGAQPRVRDEVADLAARPAAQPAVASSHAVKHGLRALGGQPHAGDAAAAHPRLPRARPVRRRPTTAPPASRCATRWTTRGATSAASCCRRRASCTSRRRSSERWPAAVRFIEEHKLNEFFAEGADDIGIIVQGGSYNTPAARARAARPGRRLRQHRRCRST